MSVGAGRGRRRGRGSGPAAAASMKGACCRGRGAESYQWKGTCPRLRADTWHGHRAPAWCHRLPAMAMRERTRACVRGPNCHRSRSIQRMLVCSPCTESSRLASACAPSPLPHPAGAGERDRPGGAHRGPRPRVRARARVDAHLLRAAGHAQGAQEGHPQSHRQHVRVHCQGNRAAGAREIRRSWGGASGALCGEHQCTELQELRRPFWPFPLPPTPPAPFSVASSPRRTCW